MSNEACVVCVDTSTFSRDGDVKPTRLAAQIEAITLICTVKIHRRGGTVGLVSYGGKRPLVCVSPTTESGQILAALDALVSEGEADVVRGMQVAQLALKHRVNKNHRQRILLFVGSPVKASEKILLQLGKQLKKNNISLDIVVLSDQVDNRGKLEALHNAVNSNDTSHIIEYSGSTGQQLSDLLISSPILQVPGSDLGNSSSTSNNMADGLVGAGGECVGGGGDNEIGVDPNTDPELYMALRLSLEEERARTQQQNQQQQINNQEQQGQQQEQSLESIEGLDDELRQALLLSMQDYAGNDDNENGADNTAERLEKTDDVQMIDTETLSSSSSSSTSNLIPQVINNLPGVNTNDPRILQAFEDIQKQQKDQQNEADQEKQDK